jgi:hypothetical protein
VAGGALDRQTFEGARRAVRFKTVPRWDGEGYTPYVFKRVCKCCQMLRLRRYRKQECASH